MYLLLQRLFGVLIYKIYINSNSNSLFVQDCVFINYYTQKQRNETDIKHANSSATRQTSA